MRGRMSIQAYPHGSCRVFDVRASLVGQFVEHVAGTVFALHKSHATQALSGDVGQKVAWVVLAEQFERILGRIPLP